MNKQEKGITLIALIITIVILIILAGVAIGAINNNNLIGYASEAANRFKDKQNKENTILTEYEDWFNNDDIIDDVPDNPNEDDSAEPKEELSCVKGGTKHNFNVSYLAIDEIDHRTIKECSDCGYKEYSRIENHEWTGGGYCEHCFYDPYALCDQVGHALYTTIEPTCSNEGKRECIRCGAYEVISRVDHKFVRVSYIEATCSNVSKEELTCDFGCGETKVVQGTETNMNNHKSLVTLYEKYDSSEHKKMIKCLACESILQDWYKEVHEFEHLPSNVDHCVKCDEYVADF